MPRAMKANKRSPSSSGRSAHSAEGGKTLNFFRDMHNEGRLSSQRKRSGGGGGLEGKILPKFCRPSQERREEEESFGKGRKEGRRAKSN